MQTLKQPYEFLARWDQSGRLSGAHVQWRYVISEGEAVVGESLSAAEPVTAGSLYPLSDLLNQLQADAVVDANQSRLELEETRQQFQADLAAKEDQWAAEKRDLLAQLTNATQVRLALEESLRQLRADLAGVTNG